MDTAIEKLVNEIDIIGIIQSRRFLHLSIKHLLEPSVIKQLKKESEKREFNIMDTSSSHD